MRWLFRWLRRLVVGGALALLIGWVALFYIFAPELPDTDELFRATPNPGITYLDRYGSLIARRGGYQSRLVRLDELPDHLPRAVLATEDRRFYQHFGMDLIGFMRALASNLRAGRVVQGGSTITQQLAKNLYLSSERRLTRKIRELILAIWLETRLSKDDILTLYLNRVYLGSGTYGVEAASRKYFGKSARDLTLAQSALIAGLLKAPSRFAPTNNLAAAQERAGVVLSSMVSAGLLGEQQAAAAKAAPAKPVRESQLGSSNYFLDWLENGLPETVRDTTSNLTLRTTFDPSVQAAAAKALARVFRDNRAKQRGLEAAIVAIDQGGAVRALIGGSNYARTPFNRAFQARRQPGSAFKPFVYLAALQDGYQPGTRVRDEPVTIDGWSPRNYDGRYRGQITLQESFAHSVNSVAVRLYDAVGRRKVVSTAKLMGVESDLSRHPSLALGTSEVSLTELVTAYVPFANGGGGVARHGLISATGDAGAVVWRANLPVPQQFLSDRTVGMMDRLFRSVVEEGTGRRASPGDRVVGGKTGTTQDARDGWFIGYSGELVLGVWVGRDDARPVAGLTGSGLPAQIFKETLQALPRPPAHVPMPRRRPGDGEEVADGWVDRQVETVLDAGRDAAAGAAGEIGVALGTMLDWFVEKLEEGAARKREEGPRDNRD
ncbi:MAG: transglycosylase domain-containing protein [Geminicoccaceae bacterium]